MTDEKYMKMALAEAEAAFAEGEVPVGCVVVSEDGEVLGSGHNRREARKSALSHAELDAIGDACKKVGDWRLCGCSIYITLEPCPMCTGAIINARIPVVVFGARERNFGSCGSVINLFEERYGHRPAIYGSVLEDECSEILSRFFSKLRD